MQKKRLAGRFLPSRVYARWVWTVRCSLFALPAILFLAGALVLFLQPVRYESKGAFKYLGKRSLPEVENLLKSSSLARLVLKNLELQSRWEVDTETAISIILEITEIKVDSKSGLIEVKVAHTDKEDARNIAVNTVTSLGQYESQFTAAALNSRIEELQKSATQLRDEAEVKKRILATLISVRGDVLADPVAQLDIAAARSEWESTLARAFELKNQGDQMNRELSSPRKWVEVYTEPEIAQMPAEKKADESLGMLIVRVLLIGLATALALPYLLELICPRRLRENRPVADVEFENADLLESTLN
jgi:hypothetical protein